MAGKAKIYLEEEVAFVDKPTGPRFVDITGQKYNRLTVLGFAGQQNCGHFLWFCRCDCGSIIKPQGSSLKSGNTKSCGCHKIEGLIKRTATHGQSIDNGTPEYVTWSAMWQRVRYPKNTHYHHYGGRGIKVCDRWLSFENFFEDMGPKPSKEYSIERGDVDGDYCPENCRWASPLEQANNTRNNRKLTHNGRTQNLGQWEAELGFKPGTIKGRLRIGWSVEKALTTPLRPQSSSFK